MTYPTEWGDHDPGEIELQVTTKDGKRRLDLVGEWPEVAVIIKPTFRELKYVYALPDGRSIVSQDGKSVSIRTSGDAAEYEIIEESKHHLLLRRVAG